MAERFESAGGEEVVEVFRRVIDTQTARQVINLALLYTVDQKVDFDDETGNQGFILWSFQRGGTQPPVATELFADTSDVIDGGRIPGTLRAVQLNIQDPHGFQNWHTDNPWSHSVVFHLSPYGKFDFKFGESGQEHEIDTSLGDVVVLHNSDNIYHRGRNDHALARHTLALFFA